MSDQRWAARYTFCDALWRGRARVVADPELEALLRESDGVHAPTDAAALELLDALLPRERGVPVWMVVASDETARMLASSRPGVRFVAATSAADVFARHPWEVALLSLRTTAEELGTDSGLATTLDDEGGAARVFGRHAGSWLAGIADAVALGRTAVIAAEADETSYEALVEVAGAHFSAARIYAMYRPAMLAFVELDDDAAEEDERANGNGLDGDDDDISAVPTHNRFDRWDVGDGDEGEGDEEDDADAVPLSFDNTLGVAEPRFLGYVAIAGSDDAPDGLTLVEVGEVSDDETDSPMRHQLVQARRQADIVAIERQRLVEHIDAIEADNAALREAVAQLRDQLAGSIEPAGAERLDAALAREQSLRWRVAALEREVEALRIRPVGDLEAELAAARAQLSTTAHDGDGGEDDRSTAGIPANGARRVGTDDARRLLTARSAGSGRTAALRAVEGLVRRIDRGAIGTIDLRRELTALRRRLRG